MYKIIDLQIPGKEFADGAIFKDKQEVIDQLANYHDIDFSGSDDKDNELSIEEYMKFWKLNTIAKKLEYMLQYGEWKLQKVY